tara:strand:- start:846 stop:1319 length:474 start_codon:yes stop_codon:yes gene_type:complete
MANLKLNVSRNMVIVPSDTIDIPAIANQAYPASSVTSASNTGKLVDSTQSFTTNGIKVGDIIQNHTTETKATVTAIDSDTVLGMSSSIFSAAGDSYSIYTDVTLGCVFYVGVAGDVKYTTSGGDTVVMKAATVGWHPVNVTKVFSTGTTAEGLLAGW